MRITIATGPLLPVPAVRGGSVPRMWMGLAEEFARRSHEVCVFARRHPGQPQGERIEGVRYDRWGGYEQGRSVAVDLAKDFAYSVRAARRLPAADILVTNNFWLPVACRWLSPSAGRIVVNANRFPKGQYFLYRGVAAIAAASRAVQAGIVKECPSLGGRTIVIPNTVAPAFLRGAPLRPRSRDGDRKTLLFVGRIHPEKGVHLLVGAFATVHARHGNWRLKIVGPAAAPDGGGGEAYLDQLRHAAGKLPVEFCAPTFDAERLAAIYRQGDLFCYPTLAERGEALPVAPIEAMACGLPVVASALDCLRELVAEGETGWTFDYRGPSATESLAIVLDKAMGEADRLPGMGARAMAFAGQFSRERVAERYLELFAALVEGRATHA